MKPLDLVNIPLPPPEERRGRAARFAAEGEKRSRYHLPESLDSTSPVGYRTRVSLRPEEGQAALGLLALEPPTAFVPAPPPPERELFEECALGVLSARQSTNFRGHTALLVGPGEVKRLDALVRGLEGLEVGLPDGAQYAHLLYTRPYRTAFTLLLTFVGHWPILSLLGVPLRALRKRFFGAHDIPTIGYLQDLHLGILADAMERATLLASGGARQAFPVQRPFATPELRSKNAEKIRAIEAAFPPPGPGWRLATVVFAGTTPDPYPIDRALCRKLGANLLAFRSERIQPGVNADESAPETYQARQSMDVPEELTVMAGRAAYNAFARWTGCDREQAKELLLLDRVDVLTPTGKERLRQIRDELGEITERVIRNLPTWADLLLFRQLTKNAARGRKAFALTGQRIYIGGLDRAAVDRAGLGWELAVRAVGAAAARSSLTCEIAGVVDLPEGCDLLAGICLMAGPVNQNDIGKQYFGYPDLLAPAYPGQDPTSLLVWTLKAKTMADPIGNEEQLLNPARKGALVDLRAGPHELIRVRVDGQDRPMRKVGDRVNGERAFADQDNFVTDPDGREIPGNRGSAWPRDWADAPLWRTEP